MLIVPAERARALLEEEIQTGARSAELRVAGARVDGAMSVVAGVCLLEPRTRFLPGTFEYGDLSISHVPIPTGTILPLTGPSESEWSFSLDGETWHYKGTPAQARRQASGEMHAGFRVDWPSTVVEFTLRPPSAAASVIAATSRVYGRGPLYPDVQTAVAHQVFGWTRPPGTERFMQRFLVVVPDYRARIQRLTVVDESLLFAIEEGGRSITGPLVVDLYAVGKEGITHARVQVVDRAASIRAPAALDRLIAHLVLGDAEVLDEIELSQGPAAHRDERIDRGPPAFAS